MSGSWCNRKTGTLLNPNPLIIPNPAPFPAYGFVAKPQDKSSLMKSRRHLEISGKSFDLVCVWEAYTFIIRQEKGQCRSLRDRRSGILERPSNVSLEGPRSVDTQRTAWQAWLDCNAWMSPSAYLVLRGTLAYTWHIPACEDSGSWLSHAVRLMRCARGHLKLRPDRYTDWDAR